MDGESEHAGDSLDQSGDGESLASGIKAISNLQTPTEPSEPESESQEEAAAAEVETEEGGNIADEQAEAPEGPAATEAAGEDGPGEPERQVEPELEPEPEGPTRAAAEEPPQSQSEIRPEEREDVAEEEVEEKEKEEEKEEEEKEEEEEDEDEHEHEQERAAKKKKKKKKKSLPRASLRFSMTREEAALVPEAEKEKPEQEEEEEGKTVAKKKKPLSRASLRLSTTGEEAVVVEAEREGPKQEEEEEKEGEEEKEEEEGEGEGGASEKSKGVSGERRKKKRVGAQKRPLLDSVEDQDEWSEEVQKLQEQQLRKELLDQYHNLVVERNRYQRYNAYLQHRICEALRKKKGLEAAEAPDKGPEPEAPEKEQAYLRYLAMLEELRKQEADDLEWYHQELAQLKQQCQEKVARVEKEWRRFQALKKQVVMQAMGSCRMRGGRQAALREVEQIQALEDKKEKEMSAVRLENVQLKQSLVHFETRMRAQEDLAEGLLLIDFEQLKIENQTFNEKVEERNDELLKLRNKVTNNVQIITHVKEKLHFMDVENAGKKAQLLDIEAQVALGRDILTKTKQARDSLRVDNIKLNQKCGLLGKESLLRDLEEKMDKTEQLNQRLESLKRHHAGLILSCRGVKQKIREAKAFLPP